MYGYRLVRSQLLWDVTDEAWSSFNNGVHIWLKNDDSLETGSGLTVTPDYWFEIDNHDNNDFCIIELTGEIASITTPGAPSGSSTVRAGVAGLPNIGPELEEDIQFATHPVEELTGTNTKIRSFANDGLGIMGTSTSGLPPYFGYEANLNFDVEIIAGWPFSGQAIAANDRFHFMFHVGALAPGGLGCSAYRKLFFALKSVNPGTFSTAPTAMAVTAKMYAHLYEFRESR